MAGRLANELRTEFLSIANGEMTGGHFGLKKIKAAVQMGLPLGEVNGDATVDDFIVRQQELAESAYRVAREQLQVATQWQ